MGSFINLCLRIPNLGSIIFFIIFVVAIPAYLYSNRETDSFKYYFPFVVMLAVVLTESGRINKCNTANYNCPNNVGSGTFENLYPQPAKNLSGFMSVNIINGLALVGILLQCIGAALAYNSLQLGIMLGVITFAITFPVAQQILPFFIREGDCFFKERTTLCFPGNWHRYLLGFLFIISLLGLEHILIMGVSQELFGKGRGSNALNLNLN